MRQHYGSKVPSPRPPPRADAPPGGVPLDQRGRGGRQVGADQGQRGGGIAGQDDPDRGGAQAAVPQAGDLGQVLGPVPAVDAHPRRGQPAPAAAPAEHRVIHRHHQRPARRCQAPGSVHQSGEASCHTAPLRTRRGQPASLRGCGWSPGSSTGERRCHRAAAPDGSTAQVPGSWSGGCRSGHGRRRRDRASSRVRAWTVCTRSPVGHLGCPAPAQVDS